MCDMYVEPGTMRGNQSSVVKRFVLIGWESPEKQILMVNLIVWISTHQLDTCPFFSAVFWAVPVTITVPGSIRGRPVPNR